MIRDPSGRIGFLASEIPHIILAIRYLDWCKYVGMTLRVLAILLFPIAVTQADTFGSGANSFTINFVTIGNAGNADDTTGYGGVNYSYSMAVNEVSQSMIDAYNALSGGPAVNYDSLISDGGDGPARPSTGISWNEAARFVNYLNTSRGYSAAYNFTTNGSNDNISLWSIGDAGYNAANPFRNSNAGYFLPSEDEWYKAAYYDPTANGGLGGYWDFATGSNSAPTAVGNGTVSGTSVYDGQIGPADINDAGGLSPYGTMAQNGNAFEWTESEADGTNDIPGDTRTIRGGSWSDTDIELNALNRFIFSPNFEDITFGFRIAAVPEPSAFFLTMLGLIGVVTRRRR